jgi:hypothetical protein
MHEHLRRAGQQADDGFQQRRFACAIGADQCQRFACMQIERNVKQRLKISIT